MKNKQELVAAMKAGMRHLASGVAVVATRDQSGVANGMTITSLTSLTDLPASLLVCLNKKSQTLCALQEVNFFSVNILAQSQQQISDKFAYGPEGEARFQYGQWVDHPIHGIPQLQQSSACFLCCKDRVIDYGNHDIVVGKIIEVNVPEQESPLLVYCRGRYQMLSDLS